MTSILDHVTRALAPGGALLPLLLYSAAPCVAQGLQFPTKPIRVIVPTAPGGPSDAYVRSITPKLTEAWGQQIVIDNRSGAGGLIGLEIAARAAPDGYTLVLGASGALVIMPALGMRMPIDTFRDLAPVTMVVVNPQLLVMYPALGVNSVKELIAMAKAKPGALNYASVGHGSSPHLGMEMLKAMAGINILHVPYKGSNPAVADIVGGQVQMMFTSMASVLPLVRAGRLRGIAVTSAKRSPAVPDIPAVAETVPDFDYGTWFGFYTSVGTPAPIINKLNAEIGRALNDEGVAKYLAAQGAEPKPTTPAGLTAYMRAENERWKKLIKSANIKSE